MSAVIRTATPFTNEAVLWEALKTIGAEPEKITVDSRIHRQRSTLKLGDIITNRSDFNGRQAFRFVQDRWVLIHDADELSATVSSKLSNKQYTPVTQFITDVSNAYHLAYQEHMLQLAEEQRAKLEAERKARVETTRQQTIAKAQAQGYAVKETRNSQGQIQLVLTRMV